MKEVFTKSFWEGVKKTFDEARDDPPAAPTPATPLEDAPPIRSEAPPLVKSESPAALERKWPAEPSA